VAENQNGKGQHQCFYVRALNFAASDPWLQVIRNDFEEFAEVFSEKVIDIFAQLERAELYQAHEVRTISQSGGDQFEGTAQCGSPVIGFRHSREQIPAKLHFRQFGLKRGALEIAFSAKVAVDRDFVHVSLRSDFSCAGTVIPMAREESRRSGKNPLL
jgi:hypothetical protein